MLDKQTTFTPPCPLHTAILFLIYKRPDTTKRVFEAIRQAKPPKLYVAADGPKPDVPGEAEKVQQARDIVMNSIDWDCEVKTLFRDKNLGCKYGVSGGIDWFFENEEKGIILEDDTLPNLSFFWFCQELLDKYKNEEQVGMISGYNNIEYYKSSNSYVFATGGSIWGWATWKRTAKEVNINDTTLLNNSVKNILQKNIKNRKEVNHILQQLSKTQIGKLDTWDTQWCALLKLKAKLSIVPTKNLIENIGFDENATHTKENNSKIKTYNISSMRHPQKIKPDLKFSRKQFKSYKVNTFQKIKLKIKKYVK